MKYKEEFGKREEVDWEEMLDLKSWKKEGSLKIFEQKKKTKTKSFISSLNFEKEQNLMKYNEEFGKREEVEWYKKLKSWKKRAH